MLPERGLPRRWFYIAAIAAIVPAVLAVLLWRPPADPAPPPVASPVDGQPQPGDIDRAAPLLLPSPRQTDTNGQDVPWGGTLALDTIRLELAGVDRDRISAAEFYLAMNEGEAIPVPHRGFSATLPGLQPGRYRWSASVHIRGETLSRTIAPPRGDSSAGDFVVPPPLVISAVAQTKLDGTSITADRKTAGGAKLTGRLQADYPGAVLELEIKRAGENFDGNGVARSPIVGAVGQFPFSGPEGGYRWRARAVAPGDKSTPWRQFGQGSGADFLIYLEQPLPPDNQTKPPLNDQTKPPPNAGRLLPSATSSLGSGSSGLSGGPSEPRESRQVPQTSFWQAAFMRLLIGIGGIVLALALVLAALRGALHVKVRGGRA